MIAADKIAFKAELKQFCQHTMEKRISVAQEAIQNAQEAANSEEKSSAGDKYETGRAMGHLQKDMHARQLTEYIKELSGLQQVNTAVLCQHACAGAVVETADASFFIGAGLGKQSIGGRQIFFLSPQAPLAAILQYKKKGDSFIFNKIMQHIVEIY